MSDETVEALGYALGTTLTILVTALLGWWIYGTVRTFFGLPDLNYGQYLLVFVLGKIMFGTPLFPKMARTNKGG